MTPHHPTDGNMIAADEHYDRATPGMVDCPACDGDDDCEECSGMGAIDPDECDDDWRYEQARDRAEEER